MSFTLRTTACKRRGLRNPAFSLIEMMVAMAILTILMVIVFEIVSSTSKVWKSTSNKMNVFQGARAGFEAMTRNLSQATLQTYLDYANSSGLPVPLVNPSFSSGGTRPNEVPKFYLRASELHFIVDDAATLFAKASVPGALSTTGCAMFFQAPAGAVNNPDYRANDTLLNCFGYFIQYDKSTLPASVTNRTSEQEGESYRYRLMEVIVPAEKNSIYQSTVRTGVTDAYNYDLDWIKNMALSGTGTTSSHPIAENVIALAILPKLSPTEDPDGTALSANYAYDSRSWEPGYGASGTGRSKIPSSSDPANKNLIQNSLRNQLPPLVEVVMVSIDETSAQRLAREYKSTPPFSSGDLNLTDLFKDPKNLESDISKLEERLNRERINYRIFRTTVPIHAAKWSN